MRWAWPDDALAPDRLACRLLRVCSHRACAHSNAVMPGLQVSGCASQSQPSYFARFRNAPNFPALSWQRHQGARLPGTCNIRCHATWHQCSIACMHACMHVRSLLMCVAVGRRCRHCVSGSRWTHLVLYSQQRETRRAYPGGAIHASRPLACTCLPMRTDWLNAARLIKLPECLCVTSRTQACF